jgi:hypothetical protein
MSLTNHVGTNTPQEKIHSPLKPKTVEKTPSEQSTQVAVQQSLTGMQWAAQAAVVPQNQPRPVSSPSQQQYEIKGPGAEDIAILSSSVALEQESVAPVSERNLSSFLRQGFNWPALEEAYRETFKKSKSHNLLLERFMANVKFSVLKGLFSLMGVSAAEQERIQREIREQALAEIDARLKNEWAYSRAMMEIVG